MIQIKAVPRDVAETKFPELKGEKIWGEQVSYDMKEAKGVHYIIYGPVDLQVITQASRIFKSVKVVTL
jgi:hypothetical protein